MSKRARDFQRSKVYRSERQDFGTPPEFRTLAECQEYVDLIIATDAWRRIAPHVSSVEVLDGRGRRSACAYEGADAIALPRRHRRRWVVLHELAHVATPTTEAVASHGPEFVAAYLYLIRTFLGEEKATTQQLAFEDNKVLVGSGL